MCVTKLLPPAYEVRREANVFSLSVCSLGGGGGYPLVTGPVKSPVPGPSRGEGTPVRFWTVGGGTIVRSWPGGGGGYCIQARDKGTPWPWGRGRGYRSQFLGQGYSPPRPPWQHTPQTGYTVGGYAPLRSRRRTCLFWIDRVVYFCLSISSQVKFPRIFPSKFCSGQMLIRFISSLIITAAFCFI